MSWFRSKAPRDTSALHAALKTGTYAEVEEHYEPAWVHDEYADHTLLTLGLTNPDPVARVDIANRLLDDGVDATKYHPLHVLLGQNTHDYEREPALLRRLIAAGNDVNEVVGRQGTPLEAIVRIPSLTDSDLAPIYDVFFERPDLDLRQDGGLGKPVIDGFRIKGEKRAELTRRAEAYLAEHARRTC